MARGPNEQAIKAKEMYKQGMKLVEIASQLNVPPGTVRRWKSTHKWDGERSEKKSERSVRKKQNKEVRKEVFDDGTKETMMNENLTHEQRLFCIYYSKIFNATQAYINAYKCDWETANTCGPRLMVNVGVKEEIQRLQEIKRQQIVSSTDDIVDLHMRIAFADIGNYLAFGKKSIPIWTTDKDGKDIPKIDPNTGKQQVYEYNVVDLKESSNTDTQLIQEVKQGKDGVSIKLADKQKSLDWLSKYFISNPTDKRIFEYECKERELRIEKQKIDIKAQTGDSKDNDGIQEFLRATNPSKEDIEALYSDEVIEDGEAEEE